jgi:hypothetical protein
MSGGGKETTRRIGLRRGVRTGLVEPALDGVRSEQDSVSGCYRSPGSGDMGGNGCGE